MSILDSWNTFVDIFLHRVSMWGVQARLLSIITPSTPWYCTSSVMLPFTAKGEKRHYILPFLSSSY